MKEFTDDEKILDVLLSQGLITEKQKNLCLQYQEGYWRKTGEKISTPKTLQKLEILSGDQLVSIIKAFEGAKKATIAEVPSEPENEVDEENEAEEEENEEEEEEVKPRSKIAPAFLRKPLLSSLKKASREDAEDEDEDEDEEAESKESQAIQGSAPISEDSCKSLLFAYALLLLGGVFGLHRFYLRYYRSGLLYSFTLGFFGVGVLVDCILLPFLLKNYRLAETQGTVEKEWEKMKEYASLVPNDKLPRWCQAEGTWQKMQNAVGILVQTLYLVVAPILLGLFAIRVWQPLLPLIVAIWSLIFLFLPFLRREIRCERGWQNIPFLAFLTHQVAASEGFFLMNKPRTLLFYFLYPITLPLSILFKKSTREEFYPFLWMVITAMFLFLASALSLAYALDFQFQAIKPWLLTEGSVYFLTIIGFACLAMPHFVSLLSLDVRQQRLGSRLFGGWSLLVSLLFAGLLIFGPYCLPPEYALYSQQHALRRVATKMQKEQYRQSLLGMAKSLPKASITKQEPYSVGMAKDYTKTIQTFMRGLGGCQEANVFRVSAIAPGQSMMLLHAGPHPLALFTEDPGTILQSSALSEEQQKIIQDFTKQYNICPALEDHRKKFDLPWPANQLLEDIR